MGYYTFKINLQPDVLLKFRKSKEDFEYLIAQEIPTAFMNVLQVIEKDGVFEFVVESQSKEVFYSLFDSLEEDTTLLMEEYRKVLTNYHDEGIIYYSQEFLKLNDKCMKLRRLLENKFPSIKRSFELITDEDIEEAYQIQFDNQVGTGVTHIKKFYKIKYYVSIDEGKSSINPLDLKSFYNPKNEHLLVESNNSIAAVAYTEALINLVNNNKDFYSKVGKININPIYESILLEGEYTEISYVLVYPNGNPPLERSNLLEEVGGKEQYSKIVGPDGKNLKKEPLKKMLEKEGRKGYLKNFEAKGKKIISIIKKINNIKADS